MAVITAVEKTGPVYRIYADGRLMARVDRACFERLPLNAGDEVDEADYLAALDRLQRPLAYEAALSALERSGKSEKALRRWLGLRGYQEGAIDEAVGRLLRARLLDDAAEAARLVETAVSGGLSRRAIQRKLYARGIDADDADAALAAVNDEDQLAAAEKLAVVLGTEGDGLADGTIAACDYTVRIPMSRGVDSLNVAAASAVAFYQLGLMSQ